MFEIYQENPRNNVNFEEYAKRENAVFKSQVFRSNGHSELQEIKLNEILIPLSCLNDSVIRSDGNRLNPYRYASPILYYVWQDALYKTSFNNRCLMPYGRTEDFSTQPVYIVGLKHPIPTDQVFFDISIFFNERVTKPGSEYRPNTKDEFFEVIDTGKLRYPIELSPFYYKYLVKNGFSSLWTYLFRVCTEEESKNCNKKIMANIV